MRAGDTLCSFEGADDELVGIGCFTRGSRAAQLIVGYVLALIHRRLRR